MFVIFKKERNELKRPNSLFQIKKKIKQIQKIFQKQNKKQKKIR